MPDNNHEIQLLQNDPGKLILLYQDLINIIVRKILIDPGYFNSQDKDDLAQQVSESLLLKVPVIKEKYNGMSLLRTFFSVIIRNICREIRRSELKQETVYRVSEYDATELPEKKTIYKKKFQSTEIKENYLRTHKSETEKEIVYKSEFKNFESILRTYSKKRAKIELCLKVIYRIPVAMADIKRYSGSADEEKNNEILKLSGSNEKVTNQEIYEKLTRFFNKYENRQNSNDAIRKWFEQKTGELIMLMNGNPPQAFYNTETFQYFVEKYYDNKME
ncbi:MAG: sigma-70 family RNA polymerase sigma factor [Bacteroidetes bacterium]|nr:sigma-70 family RNA polymerase sigma factor [Bacteroidota bacterium]MBL7102901.1 sigma-70 family RNA polymerase sigma factor [Bacteroidales bacterium]